VGLLIKPDSYFFGKGDSVKLPVNVAVTNGAKVALKLWFQPWG